MSNKKDLQLFYLELSKENGRIVGKTYVNGEVDQVIDNSQIPAYIEAIFSFATRTAKDVCLLKIELLGSDEYLDFAVDLPIFPAHVNLTDPKDVEVATIISSAEAIDMLFETAPDFVISNMINKKTVEMVNYLRHELAGAYIMATKKGDLEAAENIRAMSLLEGYALDEFSESRAGHIPCKVPQFLRQKLHTNEGDFIKSYYVGLQPNVSSDEKTRDFFKTHNASDFEYIKLDQGMHDVREQMRRLFGNADIIMLPTTSMLIEEIPEKQKQ